MRTLINGAPDHAGPITPIGISPTLLLLSTLSVTPMPEDEPEEAQQEEQGGDLAKDESAWVKI
jgi:hypothetical protein